LHGFDDRLRSYELLAEAFRLEGRGLGAAREPANARR
jgi:hypothetical protein